MNSQPLLPCGDEIYVDRIIEWKRSTDISGALGEHMQAIAWKNIHKEYIISYQGSVCVFQDDVVR